MSVETVDEHEKGARRPARGVLPRLLALPGKYPVGWAIVWTALIIGLVLIPGQYLPEEHPTGTQRSTRPRIDLAVHGTLFVGFAWSWFRALRGRRRWPIIAAFGVLLAAATEGAQGLSFINRDPALDDALADCVGLVAGLIGAGMLWPMPTLRAEVGAREADGAGPAGAANDLP